MRKRRRERKKIACMRSNKQKQERQHRPGQVKQLLFQQQKLQQPMMQKLQQPMMHQQMQHQMQQQPIVQQQMQQQHLQQWFGLSHLKCHQRQRWSGHGIPRGERMGPRSSCGQVRRCQGRPHRLPRQSRQFPNRGGRRFHLHQSGEFHPNLLKPSLQSKSRSLQQRYLYQRPDSKHACIACIPCIHACLYANMHPENIHVPFTLRFMICHASFRSTNLSCMNRLQVVLRLAGLGSHTRTTFLYLQIFKWPLHSCMRRHQQKQQEQKQKELSTCPRPCWVQINS